MSHDSLAHYRQLGLRIDQKFGEIRAQHESQFACRSGCHSCCRSGLTVGRLEKEALKAHLSRPGVADEARTLESANPFAGKRCKLLKENGDCLVYESRPTVCRTFGAPLQVKSLDDDDEETMLRDVCGLNFIGVDITKLPPEQVLNVDTINTLLALLTKRAFPGDTSRTALDVASLLK